MLDNSGQVDTFILDFEKASWLSFVVSKCEFVTFPLVSWVGCGTWLHRFLIFAPLLTLITPSLTVNGAKSCWAPVSSRVPQGTMLGPLLFSLYVNDISTDIESEIRLFADDFVCYPEIKEKEDTVKLQNDIGRLGAWARKWDMIFKPWGSWQGNGPKRSMVSTL